MIANDAGRVEIAKAGHWLIPVTAAITTVMIAFVFGMVGYWLEGTLAALGGGLSFSYLSRSAASLIDTNQLNLGFFYLLFGLAFVLIMAGFACRMTPYHGTICFCRGEAKDARSMR